MLDSFGEIELIDGSKFTFPEPVIGDLVTAPAGLVATECPFTATRVIGDTSDNNYKGIVKIGFDGTDAYIQGIDCNLPEAWAKGTYDEETKNITIPMTYMGLHDGLTHYMATYSSAGPVDLVLAYNEADSTYTSADVSFYKMPTNGVIEWFENFKIKAYDIFPFKVAVEEGTEDAENWTITPNLATEGQTVSVQYNGTKRVKSVKAVKQGAEDTAPSTDTSPALNLTNPTLGEVIGSDGKNYAVGTLPTGVTAVAMIAYVNGANGLALALADEEANMQWDEAIAAAASHTPAFTGGTWQLPSTVDWANMFEANGGDAEVFFGLNSLLSNFSDSSKLQISYNGSNKYYWISGEQGEDYAKCLQLVDEGEDSYCSYGNRARSKSYLVRAVLVF